MAPPGRRQGPHGYVRPATQHSSIEGTRGTSGSRAASEDAVHGGRHTRARCSRRFPSSLRGPQALPAQPSLFPQLHPDLQDPYRLAPRCMHLAHSILQGVVLHPPIWGHLPMSGGVWGNLAGGWELLASRAKQPGMLLNLPQCTGPPRATAVLQTQVSAMRRWLRSPAKRSGW